ncbi:MAG: relaxase/mobilization nuclease domain-containing protein [Oscillospiraceae bacterium]|nr:relaxase/mobilization nuclease domain-containing protein [Oscillospiraceae bacterium]
MDFIMIKRSTPGDDEHRENLVKYIEDDRKIAVGGNGVDYHDPEATIKQMQYVTDYYDKSHQCSAIQMIVAFDDMVKDAETAIDYARQIAKTIPDEYQSLYCVHEKDHEIGNYHAHYLINPVSSKGKNQFDTSREGLQPICDEIEEITGNDNDLIFKRNRNSN